MNLEFKVNEDDYLKFKKHLKTCIVVKDLDYNMTQDDLVLILPPNIENASEFKEDSVLKFRLLSVDFAENFEFGSEGVKKGYCIFNLLPLSLNKDTVDNSMIFDTKTSNKNYSCLAKS
jgi:hypothetical protein